MTITKIPPGTGGYARYCAFCHGSEGRGDGLNAFNLKIRPRDFTDSAAMRGKTLISVRKVIRDGGAATHLSKDMPPWGRTLDSATIDDLAGFVWWLARHQGNSEK